MVTMMCGKRCAMCDVRCALCDACPPKRSIGGCVVRSLNHMVIMNYFEESLRSRVYVRGEFGPTRT